MELDKSIFISGDKIYLRALTEADVNGAYSNWLNDAEITKHNSHGRFPVSKEKLLSYVQEMSKSNTALVLAVVDKETNIHAGNISLQGINWIDRNAEIAFLLGEKSFWGKGIMQEAGQLLIDHAFRKLNLHRIHCGTSSANIGMQKLARKLGMKEEGVRKDAIFKEGSYLDIVEYGIVNSK